MQTISGNYSRLVVDDRSNRDPVVPEPTQPDDNLAYSIGNRLLIVEDNWLVAVEMEATLLEAGYSVLGTAVSRSEAVALCEAAPPDFILMDIRLQGGSDGIEAAVEVRARFQVPSIFVSAHDDRETKARAEAAKPLGWIVKPVSGPDLIKRLERLRRHRH